MKHTIENVYSNERVENGIYKLTLKGDFKGKPGQFYMLKGWEGEPLLWRPISIHSVKKDKIEFLYAVVGDGTRKLSKLKKDDEIKLMGPLGNGFPVEDIKGKVGVVTGGIGIAPMRYVIENLKECEVDLYCGFRDDVYGISDIELSNKYISTETGRIGNKGYVTELLDMEKYDVILTCGPEIMMAKIIKMGREKNKVVYASMENKMACGVGACLVCTCKTKDGNKRTCKDGPVFLGSDVILNV